MQKIEYWKWTNTIIDFATLSNEKNMFGGYITKKDMIFAYLGTPDNKVHEWYNGGFSSEYNEALKYAKEFGLIEDYIDYEDKYYRALEVIERLTSELEIALNATRSGDSYDLGLYDGITHSLNCLNKLKEDNLNEK